MKDFKEQMQREEIAHLLSVLQKGDRARIKKILEKTDALILMEPLNQEKQTIVHILVSLGLSDILIWLVGLKGNYLDYNAIDSLGWTGLLIAVEDKNLDVCEFLLDLPQVDPKITSPNRNTALHYFVRHIFDESQSKYVASIISKFISRGTDIDAKNDHGETPIFLACMKGTLQTVAVLMAMKANLRVLNRHGETCIHYATRRGDLQILELLASKADAETIMIKGDRGTAVEAAKEHNQDHIVAFLNGVLNREVVLFGLENRILRNILSFLNVSDLVRMSTVSKDFKRISELEPVWMDLFLLRYSNRANGIDPQLFLNSGRVRWKSEYQKQYLADAAAARTAAMETQRRNLLRDFSSRGNFQVENLAKIQSLVKRKIQRKKYAQRQKMNYERTLVAKEIVNTEQSYVQGMTAIVQRFLNPAKNKSILTSSQIQGIFSDIESILKVHEVLLDDMEEVIVRWSPSSQLGSIFLKSIAYFKIYKAYVNNFNISIETLREAKKKKEFENLLKDAAKHVEDRQDIESLLLTPIQRIPRYELLLTQMVKNTWPEHIDYENLVNALEQVKQAALFINVEKKQAEDKERVNSIQQTMSRLREPLTLPNRSYIKDGPLNLFIQGVTHARHVLPLST
eukprot:TRINITY_DN6410_c1_g3_i3.p1 TRINITY_DN6410_c1_g3~~TRINITY_DN6410_c1_g3_i3.p1  ORF type:complete len:678 (+),score=240.20 TRINITY_DN6410_c1_g3_i3:156-2036(+)